ncbi:MAG: glycosyltransferase family protein [Gemmatimonadota bacterium]
MHSQAPARRRVIEEADTPTRRDPSPRSDPRPADPGIKSLPRGRQPKILLYSHDTTGLGNIRRTLLLADAMLEEYPGAAILIVTGSPMIHAFRIRAGIDYIKLPCLDRVDAQRYEPRFLSRFSEEVYRTRRHLLRMTVGGFEPDLMIVDKRPRGIDGELIDALETLRWNGRPTRLVLGMRDILDRPEKTRASLTESGAFEAIERLYDEVWIYGEERVYATATEYEFPDAVRERSHYCGYLKRPTADRVGTRAEVPRVLVTAGGGSDGGDLIQAYLSGLGEVPRLTRLRTTIVFGPQLPDARRLHFRSQYSHMPDVEMFDFDAHLEEHYARADVVVSMAGYNTICELLSFGLRAVLVPRAAPVEEQTIRARRLHELGLFDIVEPGQLDPTRLLSKVLGQLAAPPHVSGSLELGGLPRIRARARALLEGGS